jgi:hypothetical protein
MSYSHRSATTGSTLTALLAGIAQPRAPAIASVAITLINVTGSNDVTPTSEPRSTRVTPIAAGNPSARPIPICHRPCATSSVKMLFDEPPMAMRTPISRVRWLTEWALTAYNPTDASTSPARRRSGAWSRCDFPACGCHTTADSRRWFELPSSRLRLTSTAEREFAGR